ncbi:hypothetical protein C8Q75DRAFT_186987 [Abortiporus biennis]|nr:hypothetical protein C8Q75DRAFT_186987 [Abortiporus biennis]
MLKIDDPRDLTNFMVTSRSNYYYGLPLYINHPSVFIRKYAQHNISRWLTFLNRPYGDPRDGTSRLSLLRSVGFYVKNEEQINRPSSLDPATLQSIANLLQQTKDRLRFLLLSHTDEFLAMDMQKLNGAIFLAIQSASRLRTIRLSGWTERTLSLLNWNPCATMRDVNHLYIYFPSNSSLDLDLNGACQRFSSTLNTLVCEGPLVRRSSGFLYENVTTLQFPVCEFSSLRDLLQAFPNVINLKLPLKLLERFGEFTLRDAEDCRDRNLHERRILPFLRKLQVDPLVLWALALRHKKLQNLVFLPSNPVVGETFDSLSRFLDVLCLVQSKHLEMNLHQRAFMSSWSKEYVAEFVEWLPLVTDLCLTVSTRHPVDKLFNEIRRFLEKKVKFPPVNERDGDTETPRHFRSISLTIRAYRDEYPTWPVERPDFYGTVPLHERARSIYSCCPELKAIHLKMPGPRRGEVLRYEWLYSERCKKPPVQ